MPTTRPDRERPGLGGEEADRERLLEPRQRELVRDGLAERLPERDLDEIDADGVPDEIRHLAARNPRRHLDDGRPRRPALRSAAGTRSRRAVRVREPPAPRPARPARAGRRRRTPG